MKQVEQVDGALTLKQLTELIERAKAGKPTKVYVVIASEPLDEAYVRYIDKFSSINETGVHYGMKPNRINGEEYSRYCSTNAMRSWIFANYFFMVKQVYSISGKYPVLCED